MSDTNQDKTARTPRLTIDQSATPASEPVDSKAEATELQDAAAADFDEAMGLIKGTGAAIWSYAVRHPNTTLGAVAGFILAVLVLTLGLWDTLVIAFFVLIGAVIGQFATAKTGSSTSSAVCLAAANMYSTVASAAGIRRNHGFIRGRCGRYRARGE